MLTAYLVQHLDLLRPILLLTTSVINFAYSRFLAIPEVNLDDYDLSLDEAVKFFPEENQNAIQAIMSFFSFHKPLLGNRVLLLDIFTILTILVRGDLTEKAKLYSYGTISQAQAL